MGNTEFNDFMDSYIDDIRSKKPAKSSSKSKKKTIDVDEAVPTDVSHDSIYVIKKPKTAWQRFVGSFSGTEEEDFKEEKRTEKTVPIEEEQEFEQEYEEIQHEKDVGFFQRFFSFFSRDVNESYEEIDEEEKVAKEGTKEVVSEPVEEVDEVEESEEDDKKSFWARFFGFFGISAESDDDDEEEHDPHHHFKPENDPSIQKMIELKEDLKEISIIATSAFKKLPKEKFKLFKESADFHKFKAILTKHQIIRVKGPFEGKKDTADGKAAKYP